ncbi:MAG: site-2 protease family protein [Armatimonadetes bacterium]|nr:site-2 protease family protein [Armatimonadota bacterium]
MDGFYYLVVMILALTVHEFMHAKLADAAGDPTPRIYGRVTLNPGAHFDPVGFIMMVVMAFSHIGFAWGKPVPMNPSQMRNPKWDHFIAVLGGPLSNLFQAIVFSILIKLFIAAGMPREFLEFFLIGVFVNVGLFLFNLIPLGPLDGMWVLGTFLPPQLRVQWTRWNLTIGQFILLAIILMGAVGQGSILWKIIGPLYEIILRLLLNR